MAFKFHPLPTFIHIHPHIQNRCLEEEEESVFNTVSTFYAEASSSKIISHATSSSSMLIFPLMFFFLTALFFSTHFTHLSVQFMVFKNIHKVVQPSPSLILKHFHSSKKKSHTC